MTIALGLITKDFGLVSSDGRLIDGAKFEGGQVSENAKIRTDTYNKTFTLIEDTVIGVVSGLMEFQEKSTPVHLKEIVDNECKEIRSIEEKFKCLVQQMKLRLEDKSNAEIIFKYRGLDLVLVTINKKFKFKYKLFHFKFYPDETIGEIKIVAKEPIIPFENKAYWMIVGDESSAKIVDVVLKTSKGTDKKVISKVVDRAINEGIIHSQKNEYGDFQNCGGKEYKRFL
jgi:hypothetical protein